jgi:hypothetical protein
MSVNGAALVENKMRRFKGEFSHSFSFKKCPIHTHDDASEFSTNTHETDYSVLRSGQATSTKYLR